MRDRETELRNSEMAAELLNELIDLTKNQAWKELVVPWLSQQRDRAAQEGLTPGAESYAHTRGRERHALISEFITYLSSCETNLRELAAKLEPNETTDSDNL